MCGILGFFGFDSISRSSFQNSLDKLSHRGPDDYGQLDFSILGSKGILGHRRLSIQDTSSAGNQPMSSSNKLVHIVFNGEVYNFKELRSELEDFKFKSGSDTEVILELYMRHGLDVFEKLNGMFAIGIVDQINDRVILVRDRIGIKPLYYTQMNGNRSLIFASELKGIQAMIPEALNLDTESLELFLQFQYVPAPRSIFENVNKLEPGCFLVIDSQGSRVQRYWSLENHYLGTNFDGSYDDALDEIHRLIESSVNYRLIADVEVGTFLSGGIDSSLITAYASSLSTNQIKTFSIGFDVPGFNEAEFAREIANYLGTDHHELYVTPKEALDVIPNLSRYYDEPFADSSAIPTTLVSRLARKSVTVSLSGDGGDELFCGYNRYEWMNFFKRLQVIPGVSSLLSPVFRKIPSRLVKKVGALLSWKEPWDQYRSLSNIWYRSELESLYTQFKDFQNPTKRYFFDQKTLTENLMFTDIHFYMVEDILTKVDRASMSVSLESRVPLLDHRLVEFSQTLPLDYKIRGGQMKAPLKDLLSRKIPTTLFDRKKSGFAVPLKNWLKKDLNEWMKDLLSETNLLKHGFFNKQKIDLMIEDLESGSADYYYQLWTILMFQDWYENYRN